VRQDLPEADQPSVHRLESFSDIVIGFSLAQTALNVIIPAHAIDFVQRPVGILAFIITFSVIASFWWAHSTIFRNYFVPTPTMVFLNFLALGTIVLQVFALQLWLHFGPSQSDGAVAARIYFGIFAVTFGMMALMSGLGTFYQWERLSSVLRRAGVARTIRISCTVVGVVIGTIYSAHWVGGIRVAFEGHERVVALPTQIFLGLFFGDIVGQIFAAIAKRLIPLRKDEPAVSS
jgi:uncharacterized membrane protein